MHVWTHNIMPIMWRYLLKGFCQYFFLCVGAFVAVLLVMRFQEIALFISSGATLLYTLLFCAYQIPYILPIAIPISCLIASMVLFHRMSQSQEITALRSCGISILPLMYPLLLLSCVFSMINFTVISELTPISRIQAKNLIYRMALQDPLVLLQKDSMLDIKTIAFDMKSLHLGKRAEDVLCIVRQASNGRIALCIAKELSIDSHSIYGSSVSFISSSDTQDTHSFDHLMIENQDQMRSDKSIICSQLFTPEWFTKDTLLPLHTLIKRCGEKGSFAWMELVRRLYLGLCPLTFTTIGIAFGTHIGRKQSKKTMFYAFFLAALVMICFIAAKTLQKSFAAAIFLYLFPQPFAIFMSCRSLSMTIKGIET